MPQNKPSPSSGIQRESDLYAPVKAFLTSQGWDVKAEVASCDAAALKDGKLLAAELKLRLNLDVILQAVQRQRFADVVYVAVPRKPAAMRAKRWKDTLELLRRLNLGLLVVSSTDVEQLIEPAEGGVAARGHAVRIRVRAVTELRSRTLDRNTGGVRGSKLVTAYREAALRLAAALAERGPQSAKQLKPAGQKSRGTYTILTGNPYGWFSPLGGGVFGLTNAGRAALETYAEVVQDLKAVEADEELFGGTTAE